MQKLQQEAVERETAALQMELLPLETHVVKLNYANAAEPRPRCRLPLRRSILWSAYELAHLSDLPDKLVDVRRWQ
jgi:type II secretory pathway component HofQ